MKKLLRWVVVLFCTALFAQVPLFVDQYLMRLEGRLAESRLQVEAYVKTAKDGKKTLDQYIAKFLAQTDSDFSSQGRVMQDAVCRKAFLESACEALQSSSPLIRPLVFVRYLDWQTVIDTWNGFTPGLLVESNLIVWALIGFASGWAVLYGFSGLWNLLRGR